MVKILISNDDGHYAPGIRTLATTLGKHHDVYVSAPDRERSAMGHALTLHKPIRIDEVYFGPHVKQSVSVTGTPSDCVKLALNATMADVGFDMVISGINHGPNLGYDVLYSGTVSAAMEGSWHGLPSVAVSLMNGFDRAAEFEHTAEFIANLVPFVQSVDFPNRTLLNVNFPAVPLQDVTGIRLTKLGARMYTDSYERRVDPRDQVYFWLAGEIIESDGEEGTDITAIRDNAISITPVTFDLTNETFTEDHQWELNDLYKTLCDPST